MRKYLLIFLCAVAIAGAKKVPLFAAELAGTEDEYFIYYETGKYDKNTGEYILYDESAPSDGSEKVDITGSSEELGDFGEQTEFESGTYQDLLDFLGNLSGLGFDFSGEGGDTPPDHDHDDVPESVSENSFGQDLDENFLSDSEFVDDLEFTDYPSLYSAYGTYNGGVISDPMLSYLRGYLCKLSPREHYVCYRSNEGMLVNNNQTVYGYVYYFVSGEDIKANGYGFSGSNVKVRRIYNYNTTYNSFNVETQGTWSLNTGSGASFIFTDLGENYPSLETLSDRTSRQILYLCVVTALVITMIHMYRVRSIRKVGGK